MSFARERNPEICVVMIAEEKDLEATAAAVAKIKSGRGRAAVDLETAMAELARLARRADQYSTD